MKFFSIQNRRVSRGATYWLGVGIVGLVAGIGIQFTQAWSNPSGTAPTGNVAGPITTGSVGQWKTGSLGLGTSGPAANYIGWTSALEINGQAKATRYYDDDSNFFVDANSTSIMNVVRGSSFSDRENTGYYLDPNNTNRLNYVLADNLDAYGWVRGTHFIDRDNGAYHLDPNNGNRLNYVLADNLDAYGWVRGTHFIDRNDGNYYVDPNGNSRLNATYNNYVYSYGSMDANDYYIRSIGKWASEIGRYGDRFGGAYQKNNNYGPKANGCRYANPYTGSCSCPSGYSPWQYNEWYTPGGQYYEYSGMVMVMCFK